MESNFYIKSVELVVLATLSGMTSFRGIRPETMPAPNKRELEMQLFSMTEKGFVEVKDGKLVPCGRILTLFERMKESQLYGVMSGEYFYYFSKNGIVETARSRTEKDVFRFRLLSWEELQEEWAETYGNRENPVAVPDEIMKKAYDVAMGEMDLEIIPDKLEEYQNPVTGWLTLFRNVETVPELTIKWLKIQIYVLMAFCKGENCELESFRLDTIVETLFHMC